MTRRHMTWNGNTGARMRLTISPHRCRKSIKYDFRGAQSDGSGQNIIIIWNGYHSKVAKGHFTRTFMVSAVETRRILNVQSTTFQDTEVSTDEAERDSGQWRHHSPVRSECLYLLCALTTSLCAYFKFISNSVFIPRDNQLPQAFTAYITECNVWERQIWSKAIQLIICVLCRANLGYHVESYVQVDITVVLVILNLHNVHSSVTSNVQ